MKIKDFFGKGKTVFSFEVFPPKRTSPVETVLRMLENLEKIKTFKPDYISVTYGAGGNVADTQTRSIASIIKNQYHIESMAHLTCVNCTREDVEVILQDFKSHNIENILALRGDIRPDIPPKTDFRYASELTEFIKARGDFGVSGACYPEVHFEAESREADLQNLKHKVDCGAETLVTQLFFDNDFFYRFREDAVKLGINVPISAGIMPITKKSQIQRMVTTCGASIPPSFSKLIAKYEDKPEALFDAGIAYATNQIVELIASGVDGIHLYTMNDPVVAQRISESVATLL